jgi:hypothetical protein
MTREDRSRDVATAAGRRRAKKRTAGVGRTGARFPSARALADEPDEPTGKDEDNLPSHASADDGAAAAGQVGSGQAAPRHALTADRGATNQTAASAQTGASAQVASSGEDGGSGQIGGYGQVGGSDQIGGTGQLGGFGQGAGLGQFAGPGQVGGFGQGVESGQFAGTGQAAASGHASTAGRGSGADWGSASDWAPALPTPTPAPPASTSADADVDSAVAEVRPQEDVVGRTGARFGPYSARKPKRGKEFDTGGIPVVDPDEARVETPPGEPTPEQSAERTVQLVMPWAGALVRPYAHTGGRTRSSHDLALEALVSTSGHHSEAAVDEVLTTHHRRTIVDLCAQPRSVAEIAALLSMPLGVARVLLGDLATAGAVIVHPTAGSTGDGAPDVEFMRRVLVGLRRL